MCPDVALMEKRSSITQATHKLQRQSDQSESELWGDMFTHPVRAVTPRQTEGWQTLNCRGAIQTSFQGWFTLNGNSLFLFPLLEINALICRDGHFLWGPTQHLCVSSRLWLLAVGLRWIASSLSLSTSGRVPSRARGRLMARFQVIRVKVNCVAVLALAHFTYLVLGATIFQILEREAESNNRNHFQLEKLNFLANYTCLDRSALEKFVQVLIHSFKEFVFNNCTADVFQ